MPPREQLSFQKLYQMSVHGSLPSHFHARCDNRGPTLTLIRAVDGSVFGGYTSASWESTTQFKKCCSAFLFCVVGPSAPVQVVFAPVRKVCEGSAIWCSPENGPCFGDCDLILNGPPRRGGIGGMYERIGPNMYVSYRAVGSHYVNPLGEKGWTLCGPQIAPPREVEVFAVSVASSEPL